MRFLPPLVPIFIYTRHAESSIFISDTFTYIYIHGGKRKFHATIWLNSKKIRADANIGGWGKIVFVEWWILVTERERIAIELSNYRSKYRRSTNEERFPAIGADGKSDRWQKSDESGDWQRPISTNGRRDIYIYIHIHIRTCVYTNRSRYINYVACSIKIDLRLIGNARAHATRFLACSVSTDFQPRYYRVQFRNEHLANERATRTTRIEADNRAMNALTRTKPVPTINYCPPRFYDYFYDTIVVIKSFWFVEEERVDNVEESLRSEFRFEFRSRKDSISIFLDNRSSRIFEEYFF